MYRTLAFFFFLLISLYGMSQSLDSLFRPQAIDVDGYKINVEVYGEGAPIFFFAGGPGNSHDYLESNFGQYYNSHKLVFIDMLGRGLSDDAKDISEYSIANDVLVAESVRKALGLSKISILGHSYGTVVAQQYAVDYPDRVSKMILINGFHSGEMWQANCDSYNHYAKTHFPEKWAQVDSLRGLGYISSDPEFSKVYGSFPVKYIYYHDTKIQQRVPKKRFRGWSQDVYIDIVGRDADFFVGGDMIDFDVRRQLKDLDIPTLIYAGRYDGVSTPEYAIQYKTYMPQAQFEMFEQSAHNPYLEERPRFFDILDKFLEVENSPNPRVVSVVDSTNKDEIVLAQSFEIKAPINKVWKAFTSKEGYELWAAPLAEIDFRLGGTIKTNYNKGAKIGDEGTNTLNIVNYVHQKTLTLQAANFPPSMQADADRLFNVINFTKLSNNKTRVESYGIGYRNTPQYLQILNYFIPANEQLLNKLIDVLEK